MSVDREIEVRNKELAEREGTWEGPIFIPEVDIVERAESYEVSADLPGVDESGVRIELKEDVLTIGAALGAESGAQAGWRPVHQEYRTGGYHRSFRMSDRIDAGKIAARMRDGVLTLELPKAARHQPRQIQVARG